MTNAKNLTITTHGYWFSDGENLYLRSNNGDLLIDDRFEVTSISNKSDQLIAGLNSGILFIDKTEGDYITNRLLPNAPVVVQSFDLTLPNSVDYITILDHKKDRIPTMTDISITMTPIYSRSDLTQFSMDDIANGKNLKGFM